MGKKVKDYRPGKIRTSNSGTTSVPPNPTTSPKPDTNGKLEDKSRPKGFWFWYPEKVLQMLESGELLHSEAFVLAQIGNLSRSKDYCFATNAYLAKTAGLSIPRLQAILARLRKLGLIKAESGKQRRINYQLDFPNFENR